MSTVSDAFAAANPAAAVDGMRKPSPGRAGARARVHTRGYRSPAVVGKVRGWSATAWVDLRSSWWTPASLPTLSQVWAERNPSLDRVPARHRGLWLAWRAYAHVVPPLVVLMVTGLLGVLTPLVWVARHPARLLLALALAGAALLIVWLG